MATGPAADPALVSIVVQIWNSRRYLQEAIDSLLEQTYRPLEIVVVDDGSTDGGAELAEALGPPVMVYRQAHAGIGAGRNAGVARSRGKYIGFLDADDRVAGDRVTLQVAALERHPDADIVFGQMCEVRQTFWDETVRGGRLGSRELVAGYIAGAMLARREAFKRVGPFRYDVRLGDFIDWYIRANELGLRTLLLEDLVLWRRAHQWNFTRNRENFTDYIRVLHASLARRRRAAPAGHES